MRSNWLYLAMRSERDSELAQTEGIILDPVYTGRAFAGLIAAVREGSIQAGQQVVFLHSGGLPGLFGHVDGRNFAAIASQASSNFL